MGHPRITDSRWRGCTAINLNQGNPYPSRSSISQESHSSKSNPYLFDVQQNLDICTFAHPETITWHCPHLRSTCMKGTALLLGRGTPGTIPAPDLMSPWQGKASELSNLFPSLPHARERFRGCRRQAVAEAQTHYRIMLRVSSAKAEGLYLSYPLR
jgi:hypothetical protein